MATTKTWINERPVHAGGVDKLGTIKSSGDVEKRPVDVDDEVLSMLRFENGAIGSIEATRNGYGRNNFLTFEVHGEKGSISFNYERRDELKVFFKDDPEDRRGFRTVTASGRFLHWASAMARPRSSKPMIWSSR